MLVTIGTPVYRQGAYVIDKFLLNQQQIQRAYPSSELVLATCETDFVGELEGLVSRYGLRGRVLPYQVVKPETARNRDWNITCGREVLRQYVLSRTGAEYLLFLDADMVFDPSIVGIMEREITGYDAVFSGCPRHDFGTGLAAIGCVMLTRRILEKLRFRCVEFKNGEVITENDMLEMDLFRSAGRVKTGFFVSMSHYVSATEAQRLTPRPVSRLRQAANSPLVRYGLIRASILSRHNLPEKLKTLLARCLATVGKAPY